MPAQKITNPVPDLTEKFVRLYGTEPQFARAPGRVNLIGEHTDYNEGFVLPAAIQFQTTVGIATRADPRLILYSENYGEQAEFDLRQLPQSPRRHWSDYVIGVAHKLAEKGVRLRGANLLIDGDVPQGAGLSSSASLEVAVCQAFLEVWDEKMDGTEMAQLCQRAENEFVGARCGVMDQFVSVHGRKDHAVLLDCRSLAYYHEPIPEGVRLVICNTMVRHSMAGGEYNQRRHECEAGAEFFSRAIEGVRALRDVSIEEFEKYGSALPETVRKRCRHVITEDARVIEARDALARKDVVRFGQLMRESHTSLRDDFEVSCRELDVMVELASQIDGVYGARMTGGGFGGCTVNLVQHHRVERFQSKVSEGYAKTTGKRPEIYVCTAADGVRRLT
ncbi:MAG: galactokinase [Candidatus Acidiferrum sp.]